MGSVVGIYKGPASARELEGYAEIKHVLQYEGDGWYLCMVNFQGDPPDLLVKRRYNIDGEKVKTRSGEEENATPPPQRDVRTGVLGWFRTLFWGDAK